MSISLGLSACKKEEEAASTPVYSAEGTWEFTKFSCNGTELTFSYLSEKMYVDSSGFTLLSNGNGCTAVHENGAYLKSGNQLRFGDGNYGCAPFDCEYRFQTTGPGGTSTTELACPTELGSPVAKESATPYTLTSSSKMVATIDYGGGVSCTSEYTKISDQTTPPDYTTMSSYTYLTFDSPSGEYIGAGENRIYVEGSGTFTPSLTFGYATSVSYSHEFLSEWWTLYLSGPNQSPLTVGSYTSATRLPFQGAGVGLSFSGTGRGCNTLTGQFNVYEVEYDGSGVVTKLAVDFVQYCEGTAPALSGSLRLNSSVP